jgi:hypothetical protein
MFRRRGPGLVRMAAGTAVIAGTAGAVRHRQEERYARQDQEAYDQEVMAQQAAAYQAQQAQAPPPAAPTEPDYAAELQKLATLQQQGIITAEEFEAKKRQILGIERAAKLRQLARGAAGRAPVPPLFVCDGEPSLATGVVACEVAREVVIRREGARNRRIDGRPRNEEQGLAPDARHADEVFHPCHCPTARLLGDGERVMCYSTKRSTASTLSTIR